MVKDLFSLANEKHSHKNYLIHSRTGLSIRKGCLVAGLPDTNLCPSMGLILSQLSWWEVLALTGKCRDCCSCVVFTLSLLQGSSVLPENSLQAVGPDISSPYCSFSPEGFYRWGVRGLISRLSAQHCLLIPGSLEGDLASIFSLSWPFLSHVFSIFVFHSHLSVRSLQHCQPVLPGHEVWHRERDKERLTHLRKQGAAHYFSTLEWTTAGRSDCQTINESSPVNRHPCQ